MDIQSLIVYTFLGLFSIIGYFLKGKLEEMQAAIKSLDDKLDVHKEDDTITHLKIIEGYVTKVEYQNTMNRIFDLLASIAKDIKDLVSTKQDKA